MTSASDAVTGRIITAVIVVCLAGLAAAVALSVSPSLRQRMGLTPAPPPPAYVVGERIDVDPQLYANTPHTLLVFARSTCPACQKSQAAYAEFVRLAALARIPAKLVTTELTRDPEVAFASTMGIPEEGVVQTPPKTLRVTRVPLLILIDSTGVIQHLWPSIPDESQKADILETLRGLAQVNE